MVASKVVQSAALRVAVLEIHWAGKMGVLKAVPKVYRLAEWMVHQ